MKVSIITGCLNNKACIESVTESKPRRENISKDAIAAIERYNELDIELYRYAKEIFEEHIRQQPPAFERELKRFRFLNESFAKPFILYRRICKVKHFLFTRNKK